jgi:hypothetical protein
MVEKSRTRMLEVSVEADRPPRWEWQVTFNGEMIANGFADSRIEAKVRRQQRDVSVAGRGLESIAARFPQGGELSNRQIRHRGTESLSQTGRRRFVGRHAGD